MPSRVFSIALAGLDAQIIEVETDASYGLRNFSIVGLPDKAVEESKERVNAAIRSAGFSPPQKLPMRLVVNLAPADIKKEGSFYDLPIALGFLLASKQSQFETDKRIFLGELSLEGELRPAKGVLSFALTAKKAGFEEIILPELNAAEAKLVESLRIIPAKSLKNVVDHLEDKKIIPEFQPLPKNSSEIAIPNLLERIKGQHLAKRALEITAAGNHNILMEGPPGTGKSLLAKALPSIMPSLTFEESLEVTKIYSVSGLLPKENPMLKERPFRNPHHTASEASLIGGGNPLRPGEITLAHRGILFLDEFPEFHRDVLECLRQPMEEGSINILRAKSGAIFPAKFMLVAAANPCPCGFFGNQDQACTCLPVQIAKYRRKLSGPLIDRIDLRVSVPQIKYEILSGPGEEGISQSARNRIFKARIIQNQRLNGLLNSEIPPEKIAVFCKLDPKSETLAGKFVNSGQLSARGFHRVLKVARTIADLEGSDSIRFDHFSEALMYRLKENNLS